MKRLYIILLLAFVTITSQAQRFEWAKGYEVADEYRKITGGITDSLGNLYILSPCDALSSWGDVDFIPSIHDLSKDLSRGIVIAKISTEGEIVWKKVIFSGPYNGGHKPQDIKKVGDSAFACLIQFEPSRSWGYTYYLDTIVWGESNDSNYPVNVRYMGTNYYTLYLLFDFDGNVIEQHFLNITFTDTEGNDIVKYYGGNLDPTPWLIGTWYFYASFDIDDDGNVYICRRGYDWFRDSTHECNVENGAIKGLKFWVDGRLAGEYRIEGNPKNWYPQLIKFSPHFDTLLGCIYVIQKDDCESLFYHILNCQVKTDNRGNVFLMSTFDHPNANNTMVFDSLSDFSFSHFSNNFECAFLVKYTPELSPLWVIAFEDSIINPSITTITPFYEFDFDYDSNLLLLYAVTSRSSYRDTVNFSSILTYHGMPLNLKSHTFFCAFDNNDTNPTIHSYNNVPEKYVSAPNVYGKCGNNRVILQNQYGGGITFPTQTINLSSIYDNGFAMTMFDYSGRVIGGVDYGVEARVSNYAGPIIQHDSILYLCNLFQSDARFGDIDFTVLNPTNCIAKYVDTALMQPYVWNPVATGYRSFFGSESTEWYWIKPFVDGGTQAWRFVMDEDSVVDGVNYRLIRGYLLSPVDTTDMTGMPFDDYDGALVREDTVAGRLWYRDDNEEVLLVDMSLQEGDIFNGYTVQSVEYDTAGRKKILFDEYGQVFWLEGVGPKFLLGYPNLTVCVFHDGEKVYRTDIDYFSHCPISNEYCRSTCDPMGVSVADGNSFKVSPNPCASYVSMELLGDAQVTVYDALGHVVRSMRSGAGRVDIDMSALSSGVYYICTAYSDRMQWNKIIKQ